MLSTHGGMIETEEAAYDDASEDSMIIKRPSFDFGDIIDEVDKAFTTAALLASAVTTAGLLTQLI